ncbi:MAG: hypothetical protein IJJ14_00080, partial [Coriobacteriales bacterium]|nr:hypothetical protein [Coriobacteriales bacterium]
CQASGIGITKVSEAMGRQRTFISSTLSKGVTPKADTLAQIAAACGYRLVLVGNGEEIEIEP